MIKTCVVCGGEFEARTCAKVCSAKCRTEKDRINHKRTRDDMREHHPERYAVFMARSRINTKRWQAKNPEKVKASMASWKKRNPSKNAANARAYAHCHRDAVLKRAAERNARRAAAERALRELESQLAEMIPS